MANKHRGEVEIILDKPRKLRYTTHALAELEDALGHPLSKIDPDNTGIRTTVKMFWAGLLHETPDLTLKEAADLMDYSDFGTIVEKISEAMDTSFGNSEEPKNKKSGLNSAGQK